MARQVIIYTRVGCADCEREKELLSRKGVAFEERDLGADKKYADELTAMGINVTPVTLIDDELVVGFEPQEIEALLKV